VADQPQLSYLSHLLGDEASVSVTSETSLPSLSQSRHLTFFAPSDDAFRKKFDHLERKYLESDWGFEGIRRVLGHHMITTAEQGKSRDVKDIKGVVGWRSSFQGKKSGEKGKARKTRGQFIHVDFCHLRNPDISTGL
jgi:uncharacterized surface protein with fasciclin (FAS1) repeats